jgi:hypothetical protein
LKLDFTEYLEPVDFPAYYATQKKIIIFQAPKKVCKGVFANLRKNDCGVRLIEMEVDFAKVLEEVSVYQAAWFRSVSTRVHAAGIHGEHIQDDTLFKKLLKVGELSNVTIPWRIDGAEHRVMITSSCAIVLAQNYKSNIGLELRIVMDVYDKLLSKVWRERKIRKKNEDCPGEP